MSATRMAAIQMVSGPEVGPNLTEAGRLLEQAAAAGARLAALPEFFPLMGLRDTDKIAVQEAPGRGPIQAFLADSAQRLGLWIVAGSVPLQASVPDKVRNSCLVFDPTGRQVGRYDKIHLFGFDAGRERYAEANTIEPGERPVALDTPFGRFGLSICYDVRFPELYRALGRVDVLTVPSAFTVPTGQAHWEILLRARAIENQAYLLAPAQGGTHASGRKTYGNSLIIDPWGEVLARLEQGPGVILAEIDLARVAAVRTSLPALEHRRLDPT